MRPNRSRTHFFRAVFCALFLASCTAPPPCESSEQTPVPSTNDPYTLAGPKDFLRDYPAIDEAGLLNVVVEIPAGTSAKWEVDKIAGLMRWNHHEGKPRVVAYLPYPGNYGMVPRSYLPRPQGGDGDPLDVIVLGPGVPRGTIVQTRLLGMLKMLDGGERDDKLIAVLRDSPLGGVADLDELQREFPGVTEIIEIWFANYKGPGVVELQGYGDREDAEEILQSALAAYRE